MMIVRVAYIATSKSRAGSRTALAGSPPVIPTDWTPVHRADGELVGWLATDGAPRLLTGAPLALPADDGVGQLRSCGLAALDRRWWGTAARAPPAGTSRPASRTRSGCGSRWRWWSPPHRLHRSSGVARARRDRPRLAPGPRRRPPAGRAPGGLSDGPYGGGGTASFTRCPPEWS